MCDHHCLYQGGWDLPNWCDQCAMDWISFLSGHQAVGELMARAAYEVLVERWCDEPLPCRRPEEHQLALPWSDPARPADVAELTAGWSFEQLEADSPN
jgi:hypothetical protein